MRVYLAVAGLVLGLAAVAQPQSPAGTPPQRLSEESYAAVRAYAQPRPADLAFESIGWHENLVDGALAAQKQDRPLVLWLYFGDPRGGC